MDQHKFEIAKTELQMMQQQMDKYDQLGMTIKTWSVTLWVAASGWAFLSMRREPLFLAAVLVAVFWFFDALNKTFRENYKRRRDQVATALESAYHGGDLPQGFSSPHMPVQDQKKILRQALRPHIALPYLVLMAAALVLFAGFY
jgi:hypothetical protein